MKVALPAGGDGLGRLARAWGVCPPKPRGRRGTPFGSGGLGMTLDDLIGPPGGGHGGVAPEDIDRWWGEAATPDAGREGGG